MFKKLIAPMSALAISAALVACQGGGTVSSGGGGSSSGGGYYTSPAQAFVNKLNMQDLTYSYTVKKDPTYQGGGWIVVQESNGNTYAVDVNSTYRSSYSSDLSFYLNESYHVWPASTPGYYIDKDGYLYQSKAVASKDLETIGAQVEKLRAANYSQQLIANYGLSEDRGLQLAQLLIDYKNVTKSRKLTAAEENAFSKQALGFTVAEADAAAKSGNAKAVDSLIAKAAAANDTSVENIRDMMGSLIQ